MDMLIKKAVVVLICLTPDILLAQGTEQPRGSVFTLLFPFILIFVIMYFLLIRPQVQQEKKRKEMISRLKKGDRVVTQGGVLGTITKLDENVVTLKIADNVNIKVEKNSVKSVLSSVKKEE